MTFLLKFLEPVWLYIFWFFVSLAISNAITWLLRYSLDELTETFRAEIESFIRSANQYVLNTIVKTDDLLDDIVEQIFTKLEKQITAIEEWFSLALADAGTAINEVLSGSSFLNFVEEITQFIVDAAGNVVKAGVLLVVDDVIVKITELEAMLQGIQPKITAMENYIYGQIINFTVNLLDSAQEQVNQVNDRLSMLWAVLNNSISFCNNSIDTMAQSMNTACTALEDYNTSLESKKTQCLDEIRALLQGQNNPYEPHVPIPPDASRKALVVGINEFAYSRMNLPASGAATMSTLLESFGYTVSTLVNEQATRDNILNAITNLMMSDFADSLVLYINTHGGRDFKNWDWFEDEEDWN